MPAPVTLSPGLQVVAFKLQEAMNHGDVYSKLQAAIRSTPGTYGDYVAHTGDGESGDVVYTANGDLRKASYEIGSQGGKAYTNIDMDNAVPCTATTSYDEMADDDDHYASMEESFKTAKLYTSLPLYERFISKSERDNASSDDFAGKGKSFPILKASDVGAAVHAMGRAGSSNYGMAQLKANIIRIAKAKGFTSELPKAWRGDDTKASEAGATVYGASGKAIGFLMASSSHRGALVLSPLFGTPHTGPAEVFLAEGASSQQLSHVPLAQMSKEIYLPSGERALLRKDTSGKIFWDGARESGSRAQDQSTTSVSVSRAASQEHSTLNLVESANTIEQIVLREAKADYEIKLIAPGKGSSAFYPKEVLQRDGPKVFKAGTHVYLNHPTAAEESARPEGDVKNLAGVLASDAVYNESHAKGPGLYARMKVFADHGQMVEEKAAHVGMSIRANGVAESGKQRDGLPILKELTSAESVDVVTRAGAGGMILTEAARPNSQEGEMTLQEAQKLIDEGIAKATSPLLERAIKGDAREEAEAILKGTAFKEARFESARAKIVEAALRQIPKKDGALDVDEFRKIVAKEAKDMGDFLGTLMGTGEVRGMGPSFNAQPVDEEKLREAAKRQREDAKALDLEEAEIMSELTGLRLVKKEEAA